MARKRRRKKKFAKRLTLAFAIIFIVAGALLGFGGCLDEYDLGDLGIPQLTTVSTTTPQTNDANVYVGGDLEIHFLELGNKLTGDCTYIKAGDNDILIDAGSDYSSIPTINAYLSEYVTDGILEYVIVTHAHKDHYAGFAVNEGTDGIFDLYECQTIIDFSQVESGKVGTKMYENYIRERDAEIAAGAEHYTAAECIETGNETFQLGEGMSIEILDSYFYYNRSSTENNHSVCLMIHDGERNYLFTGDLEKEGEEKLVEMNDLPEVDVYKAGHHGSKTSSHNVLLSVIKPDIVCVCCCAGSSEYTSNSENQFPTQDFIDRIAPHTEAVFVTTLSVDYKNGVFTSMNGNIIIRSTKEGLVVDCSSNNTPLGDTEWFKNNRVCPDAWK